MPKRTAKGLTSGGLHDNVFNGYPVSFLNFAVRDPNMSVSIKDVAHAAGVSVATVSRVLSNGPVSDALRQRVEDAVCSTGYRPNLSARRLRSQ
ncbi:LacI family DNA-binding transcriptional regulator, partial [Vibrio parahaemolyticus]